MHYYDKLGVATIKLVSPLKLKDKIVVIGKTTGIIYSEINSMERKNKKIKSAKKSDEIGIQLPLVRKNDEVYVLRKSR